MEQPSLSPVQSSEKIVLLRQNDFIILNFFTFNLYSVWWAYKSWKFFKEKDLLDIQPALRALFGVVFLYSLFERIKHFAESRGCRASYSSFLSYVGVLVFVLFSYLPAPFFLITFLNFICYVPAVGALNAGILQSNDLLVEVQASFNVRQKIILIIGGLLWSLVFIGLLSS
jgi:hypothetical protein